MPEFQLNTPNKAHPFYTLSAFARGYVEAMFFTNGDTGDERENLLNELGVEKLTRKAVKDIAADCDKFLSTIMPDGCFVQQWIARAEELDPSYDETRAGHDLWFSRQGHGVGFWDRGLGEIGDGLDEIAKAIGEAYPEVSRGWIYHR